MTKAEKLRQLFQEKSILKIVGAHDALGAKLVEKSEFDGVWASGFEIASAHGVPDANILTMKENLDVAMIINEATQLPVICDCDTGYGNANNVMYMIRKYESAGMAAVVIEDKCFPKVNSFIPGRQELASVEEFAGKIEAAREARNSENGLMIFARVEALIAGWGMEEALKRARAYYKAGADGIVIHSKSKTPDEIFTFARLWNKETSGKCPIICIPTTYSSVTAQELSQAGFKMTIYANQGIRASVKAMSEVFRAIQEEGSTESIEKNIATMQELFQLQGMPKYQEQEKLFSRKGEKITAIIPAAGDHHFQPDLASYLYDKPLCMLEIGGKPLLENQLDTLRSLDIQNIIVVTGFRQEKIQAQGIQKVENKNYEIKGSAYSLAKGLTQSSGKTFTCFSDIIFDRQIAESLLKSPYPITLVIDRSYKSLPRRDKTLDLVLTDDSDASDETRKMRPAQYKRITKIGKKLNSDLAQHEFIGMMLFSAEGLELYLKAWTQIQKEFAQKKFYEAESAEKSSVTDVLQYLIDQGTLVVGQVIEHGWSEIYSLADYERVNSYFSGYAKKEMGFSPAASL